MRNSGEWYQIFNPSNWRKKPDEKLKPNKEEIPELELNDIGDYLAPVRREDLDEIDALFAEESDGIFETSSDSSEPVLSDSTRLSLEEFVKNDFFKRDSQLTNTLSPGVHKLRIQTDIINKPLKTNFVSFADAKSDKQKEIIDYLDKCLSEKVVIKNLSDFGYFEKSIKGWCDILDLKFYELQSAEQFYTEVLPNELAKYGIVTSLMNLDISNGSLSRQVYFIDDYSLISSTENDVTVSLLNDEKEKLDIFMVEPSRAGAKTSTVGIKKHGIACVDMLALFNSAENLKELKHQITRRGAIFSDYNQRDFSEFASSEEFKSKSPLEQAKLALEFSLLKINNSYEDARIATAAHILQYVSEPMTNSSKYSMVAQGVRARAAELKNRPSEPLVNSIASALGFDVIKDGDKFGSHFPNLLIFNRLVDAVIQEPDAFGIVIDQNSDLADRIQVYGQLYKLAELDGAFLLSKIPKCCYEDSNMILGKEYSIDGSEAELAKRYSPFSDWQDCTGDLFFLKNGF
jgi:hypothetical protein